MLKKLIYYTHCYCANDLHYLKTESPSSASLKVLTGLEAMFTSIQSLDLLHMLTQFPFLSAVKRNPSGLNATN